MSAIVKCKICGSYFKLEYKDHYIARDRGTKGGLVQTMNGQEETKMYDAYDCPHCGSQYIAQERKRLAEIPCDPEEPYEGQCDVCKHFGVPGVCEPCASCNHSFGSQNNFEEKDK